MKRKDGLLVVCIAMVLCLCLIPSAMATTEEQEVVPIKDAAQLKMEELEAELGEEGMQKVESYLALQASLPDVVKNMPYRALAFAGTQEESRSVTFKYIDGFDVSEKEKELYKAGIENIWNRYPEKITKDDYKFMSEIGPMLVAESLEGYEPVSVKWASSAHQDYAYYACDGSSYRSYAQDAADDPDNGIMDPLPVLRYYNHYEDGALHVGGAPGRCDEFADSAIFAKNNGYQATAHQRFGYSSHYLTDPGIPFHSTGVVYQGVDTVWNGYENSYHYNYENYVSGNWTSGYDFQYYVRNNYQSNTVTDPQTAVEDNAEHSSQYFDYIWTEMYNDPQNFGSDMYVAYYTAQCVQETAKYTHGLYDYIM
ncbi:hypothetical protein [Methanococcoides sp. LMO-2]|uniref:Phospholipase C n=1 Tax=Methanococcoides cohabitans TaxID=3136559 RepID=A0ABU9KVE7_9EURY